MTDVAGNLNQVLRYFEVSNKELALALGVDPSLVSRWTSGQRKLRASSPQMEALAEYILSRAQQIRDVQWLKARFEEAGLVTDIDSVYRIKQNLVLWLASDGAELRRNLGGKSEKNAARDARDPQVLESGAVKIGLRDIVLAVRPLLEALPDNSLVDIFLSSDRVQTIVRDDFARLMLHALEKRALKVRMVVCVSGSTEALSGLIDAYMTALISGRVHLSVVHGMTQTVTYQMHMLSGERPAVLVTETLGGAAPPVATFIGERAFVAQMQRSFEEASRYAQPVLNVYGDDYSRNILEILYMEYCTPGALDVVKDSVNPIFMTQAGYDRFLKTMWAEGDPEYAWRSAEFARFKAGVNATLEGGSVFREILSLSRLSQIARDGKCRMLGLYFMRRGFVDLDAEACVDLLGGYIEYLESAPGFRLTVLDDLLALNEANCWHIKQNRGVSINHWSGREPVMIYSDQLMLTREFQARYDALWARGEKAIANRAGVIVVLRDIIERLQKKCARPAPEA